MLATCEHCGHRNDVPDSAANTEVICQKCAQPFFALTPEEAAASRRATKLLIAAVLVFLALILLLLFSRSTSRPIQTARRALVGGSATAKLNSAGQGTGEEGSDFGSGPSTNDLADSLATNGTRRPDASIGRLPHNIGERPPGDETRAGAAGSDDPAERVGNSPTGQITNAPSAGGNRGNSDRRNSIETPEGDDELTGAGTGADPSVLTSTNSRSTALLLDDFSERLRQAGARSGDVQVSLEWKNINDLDLHIIDPAGERIFYRNRASASGGQLDIDMNAGPPFTARPVENVYWPERGAPRGAYKVQVIHFANNGARDPTQFTIRVINKGQSTYYRGYIRYVPSEARAHITVCTFNVQ
jgi:hypothetical protein